MTGKAEVAGSSKSGVLYIVATPIGNIEDITIRAGRILTEVNYIAAEDTRIAGLLLKDIGVKNKLISLQKFNEKSREDQVLDMLEKGMNVAIISDAGTPCISDPGGIIVKAAAERGIRVVAVCGASAVITALSICGFEYSSFTFHGFFPRAAKDIAVIIKSLQQADGKTGYTQICNSAHVFFESPKRIKKTMEAFADDLPDFKICLCNDLTKKYERIYRGTAGEILEELIANPSSEKGEYTMVVHIPASEHDAKLVSTDSNISPEQDISPEAAIVDHMVKNGVTAKEAISALSEVRGATLPGGHVPTLLRGGHGYKKKDLYSAALNLKNIFNK